MIITPGAGIAPHCTIHHAPMTLAELSDGSLKMKVFRCDEPGCTRTYDLVNGYFDIVGGRALWDKTQQLCPNDGTRMYLETAGVQTETWRCGQLDCGYSQEFHKTP